VGLFTGDEEIGSPGCRRTTKLRKCGEDEAVHRQAGLHVSDTSAVGDAVTHRKWAARCLSIGEDGVAMAHQNDIAARIARCLPWDGGSQAIAMMALRHGLDRKPMVFQEAPHHAPTASIPFLS
jgi:hypothetical protein